MSNCFKSLRHLPSRLCAFILLQVALSAVVFELLWFRHINETIWIRLRTLDMGVPIAALGATEFRVAVGESQIALAALLCACSTIRWGLRLPLVSLLFFVGSAAHYIALVHLAYPYVGAEEYAVSVLLAVSEFVTLRFLWGKREFVLVHRGNVLPVTTRNSNWLAIRDLFLWSFVVALVIPLCWQAMRLTDVSGMYDPWETLSVEMLLMPSFLFPRLPFLVAALALHAVVWGAIATLYLRRQAWLRTLVGSLLLYAALTSGEALICVGYRLFGMAWPFLPVSSFPALGLVSHLQLITFEKQYEFSAQAYNGAYTSLDPVDPHGHVHNVPAPFALCRLSTHPEIQPTRGSCFNMTRLA